MGETLRKKIIFEWPVTLRNKYTVSHDGCDEECFVPELWDDDDGERGEEAVDELVVGDQGALQGQLLGVRPHHLSFKLKYKSFQGYSI